MEDNKLSKGPYVITGKKPVIVMVSYHCCINFCAFSR